MAELRSSYRRMALRTHPDKGGSPEDFRQVLEAFAVLSSSRTRAAYDSSLRARKEAASSRSGRTTRDTRRKSAAAEQQQQQPRTAAAEQQEQLNKTREKPEEGRAQPASSSPQQQTDAKQQQRQQQHHQQECKSSSVPSPKAGSATAKSQETQGQGCGSDAEKASTQPSSTHPTTTTTPTTSPTTTSTHGVSTCMARLRALAIQMPRTQREASLQALLPQLRSRLLEFMQGHRKPEVSPGKAQQAAERRHSRRGMCGTEVTETPQERMPGDPLALAPVSPRSYSSSSSASDESGIDEVLALENEECSMLLAIENAADVDMGSGEDDSVESDPDCKLPTAATRASRRQAGSGYRGVFRREHATGSISYQAAVSVSHVSVKTSYTANVEESVDFHIILVQLRECVEEGVDGSDGVEGPLAFEQSFRAAYRQRQGELSKMSLSFVIVFAAFGVKFHTPSTSCLEEALEVRSRLLAAREQGVSALKAYLLELLLVGRTNVHRRSKSWTLAEAQDFVGRFDAKGEAIQLKREALRRRKKALEERLQQRRSQKALRDARKVERRQQRLQQRWQRVAGHAQLALQQEQKLSASSQQQAAVAAAATARAKAREEARARRVAEGNRRKLRSWTSMKNLTFEEQQAAAETAAAAAAASRNTYT
ncbi:unnamed protein product [Polarella glacialis]|uniref:J domain-containing protein n=1 Tax=Polarella glacialis TaxID=89957 RepID=A0A813HNP3_POLGL|nr:unnamed protein product [Polarella glacialis]CAE8680038.1 unnamed protein product [Polarella glacialis]